MKLITKFILIRKTLDRIRNFDLHKKNILPAEETSVSEFTDLNRFVEQMTRKVVTDYKNLKEFTENAPRARGDFMDQFNSECNQA